MAKDIIPTLHPEARPVFTDFFAACKDKGLELLAYCGHRTAEEQARLFRRSRSALQVGHKCDMLRVDGYGFLADILAGVGPQASGPWATNAAPGESWHNYGMAIDLVLIVDGKPDWDTHFMDKWVLAGDIAKAHGLEWAGTWKKSREFVHFQYGIGSNPLEHHTPEEARHYLEQA